MSERIKSLEIDKLFGRFDYVLNFESQQGISILTAPNGFGKSTILRIIHNFALGNNHYFVHVRFESIRFYLTSGEVVEIVRSDSESDIKQVTIQSSGRILKVTDFFGDTKDNQAFVVEGALPFLTRISAQKWRHDRTGETFDGMQILDRYGDHPVFKRKQRRERWLDDIQKSLLVFSISTHRLKTETDFDSEYHGFERSTLMIDAIASEIREQIQSAIRNQFDIGRKKESSFPTRLIESLRNLEEYKETEIVDLITSVQQYEGRLSRLGLVPHTATTDQLRKFPPIADRAGMLVLKTYLDDVLSKFEELNDLANRLDVFCNSLNSLLAFKAIETSADEGIIVRVADSENDRLSLQALSSGEQHLIVLIGKLIFGTDSGAFVLIDEPEISFHPEWQEKFISILENIRRVNGFSVLIATHSPILISEHWDIVVELAEQYSGMSNSRNERVR